MGKFGGRGGAGFRPRVKGRAKYDSAIKDGWLSKKDSKPAWLEKAKMEASMPAAKASPFKATLKD